MPTIFPASGRAGRPGCDGPLEGSGGELRCAEPVRVLAGPAVDGELTTEHPAAARPLARSMTANGRKVPQCPARKRMIAASSARAISRCTLADVSRRASARLFMFPPDGGTLAAALGASAVTRLAA